MTMQAKFSQPCFLRWIKIACLLVATLALLVGCGDQLVKPMSGSEPVANVHVDSAVQQEFDKALLALNAADYDTAIALLKEVINTEQRLAAPYINLGMAYQRKGDNKNAEVYLRKAVDIDLGHPVANNELGMLYRKLGRFDDARHAYDNALTQHPDYLPAIKNLGILCDLYLQDVDCALKQYERFLEYVPDDKTVAIWVVDIKRRAGR